jgi:hypothetical protein
MRFWCRNLFLHKAVLHLDGVTHLQQRLIEKRLLFLLLNWPGRVLHGIHGWRRHLNICVRGAACPHFR